MTFNSTSVHLSGSTASELLDHLVAVISSIDSKGSIIIHKKLGFRHAGVLKKIGFKNKKWIDSIFMQKNI